MYNIKRKKFFTLTICIIFVLSLLTACQEKKYPEYNFQKIGADYKLELLDETFLTKKNCDWVPNTRWENVEDNIIGKCSHGYIITTTSESCLLVYALGDSEPYLLYREGFRSIPISAETISEAAFTAYGDEGLGEYDKGPTIDVTNNIENILELYKNGEKYVYKNFDYTYNIGDITLRNKEDSGLFHRIPIYFDGTHYYLLKNKKYIMCDEIIPENINILKEYKDSIFNK